MERDTIYFPLEINDTYLYRYGWGETDCIVLSERGRYTRSWQQKINFDQFVSQLCTSHFFPMPVAENPLMPWLSVHHRCGNVKKSLSQWLCPPIWTQRRPRTCAGGDVILWWHFPVLPVNDDNITEKNQTVSVTFYNIDHPFLSVRPRARPSCSYCPLRWF